ncbi:dockerin type I domain-containing protein [Dehalococcoidia bacterium]|nr:dockerin type I domain-containing protein [Dehalococcoidia bacterium]
MDTSKDIVWLDPMWNNNTFARAVWPEFAAEHNMTTLSDLASLYQAMEGDISGNDQVDAVDLATVVIAFNSPVGGANWNEDADLNQDGIVDIFDLVKVGRNFSAGQDK